MANLSNYEQTRQIIMTMNINYLKKIQLVKNLNDAPDIPKQEKINYESRFCTSHEIEVDFYDKEMGDITLMYYAYCESETLAKEVTKIKISRDKKYNKMQVKGMYIVL